MKVSERVLKLRELMQQKGIDAYLVPTADYHNSEYVGEHFKERVFITGFTGSAGTALILKDKAGLWTDGRYFLQAESQLEGSGVELYKMGVEGVPSINEFLESELGSGAVLGFDGRSVPFGDGVGFESIISSKNGKVMYNLDLIDEVWADRPPLSEEPAFYLEESFSGESAASKISRVRAEMEKVGADAHIITTLDDTGWLLNLRGRDVEYFPMLLSYSIVYKDKVVLYVDERKFNDDIKSKLAADNVEIKSYNDIYEDVKTISGKILIDPDRLNYAMYKNIPSGVELVEKMNPTIMMKAMKNETEIKNIKHAHIKDGVAHTKFIYWIKKLVKEGKIAQETEMSASDKLEELRAEQGDFICPSFGPISAYAAHAANPHYSSSEETNVSLEEGNLFLTDTGAGFMQGSTDITRTTAIGEIPDHMKVDYTLVLQSNLRLTKAKFMYGCTGVNLDILARQPLWDRAMNYNHGTGHGVGYLGNIHETSAGIRWQYRKNETIPFEEGMIVTNEPGLYIAGSHGIRLENELLTKKMELNDYGQFMEFEPITFVPFDMDAIKVDMLSEEDKKDLNNYHEKVRELIGPHLTDEERAWLNEFAKEV
ncbi:aminopeptidase P family N-terminal domain-containing protein [Peptostreptococcus faecalis]|uniref:aminopeptidase P family N-terminal domain-containing protein n=1 Tax=Peptostreptococcus faecalis TaxID=2045015 RepID=UPI000C7C9208|nr:aminopeptidase P family N-terminal domain-containing protein [Peptostreptococcus faecalis]